MSKNNLHYETRDLDERKATLALHNIFVSIAKAGMTEDPLDVVCRCIVKNIDDVQFAYYAYEGFEDGKIAAVKDGLKLFTPSPSVERKILANYRRQTQDEMVAVIDSKMALSLLAPADRKLWKCHTSMVTRLTSEDGKPAVLALFFDNDFVIEERHKAWMTLFGEMATAFLMQQRALRKTHGECDEAKQAQQKMALALDAIRKRVREHLQNVSKLHDLYREGNVSLREAVKSIESSASSLYEFSDVVARPAASNKMKFKDVKLGAWVREGMNDRRIKVIAGLRGSGKSAILHAIHDWVLVTGVKESNVVIIDFEDARFRRFKMANDVIAYLASFPKSNKPYYLFMDEVGRVNWHTELLRRLQSMEGWNVWLASSSAHALRIDDKFDTDNFKFFRAWTNHAVPRSHSDLERIWCQIFMRDAVSGGDHPDVRAKEALAEYYSDHLGESRSFQEISQALQLAGRKLSRSSISAYRQSLIDAYLIEISEVYDLFEKVVVTSVSGRAFYTDLELRTWRYGSSFDNDGYRLALNRLYLELRRDYDKVYTPRNGEADFVTFKSNGEPMLWKLPGGGGD